MAAAPAWKAWLGWAARLGLVAALLGFLWSKGFLSLEKTALVLEHPAEMSLAVLLMFTCQFLGAYRWNVLLGAQALSIYVLGEENGRYLADLRAPRLGRVSVGKSCIRLKRLERLDLGEFRDLIAASAAQWRAGSLGEPTRQ